MNSKKNFWIAFSLPIAVFVGYAIYMIYSYSTGKNNDFERRHGLVITEEEMMIAVLPNGDVMNAREAIALVRDKTKLLETIAEGKIEHGENKEYNWKATAVKDAAMKDWDVIIREYKVKPRRVCTAKVITWNQEVQNFRCFIGKI